MRILVIGDFHGEVPAKLKRKIRKINFDFILSPGDFAGGNFGKELLKYEIMLYKKYGANLNNLPKSLKKEVEEKYAGWNKEAIKNSEGVINWLKSLEKPVYFVYGNWDFLKKERKGLTKTL